MLDARKPLIDQLVALGAVTPVNRRFVESYQLPRIGRIHELIRKHAPAPLPLRVLNIGLLDGLVPLSLLQLDEHLTITSTERPKANIEQSAGPAALQATGRHDVATLDLTARDALPEAEYDWVVCGEVLEHLPSPSLPQAMRNLRDAAEKAVITTPNLHALRYRLRHVIGVDFQHDPVPDPAMGLGHVSLLSARLLIDLAADAGLSVTDLEFHSWTSRARGKGVRALSKLANPFPSLADDLVAAFRRDEHVQPSVMYGGVAVSMRDGSRAALGRAYRRR